MPKPPRKANRRDRFKPEILTAGEARKLKQDARKSRKGPESKKAAATTKQTSAGNTGRPSGKPSGKFNSPNAARKTASANQTAKPAQRRRMAPAGPAVFEPTRIAKAMARAGLCSRRDAERWIEEGRVSVNGKTLTTPAIEIGPKDRVKVDGQPLPLAEPPRLWRFHKPKGCVTTHRDPQGRPTVFDNLPEELPRVVTIGRLDYNTEGLLLLTNDGALARYLELPDTGWLRRYRVRAKGRVNQAELDKLKDGVEIDGIRYREIEASLDSVQGANSWLTIGLREGKNREVRRVLSSLGLEVNRLIRISFGPFQLLDLPTGEVEIIRRKVLSDQLGPRLAQQFGLRDEDDEAATNTGAKNKRPGRARPPRKPTTTRQTRKSNR